MKTKKTLLKRIRITKTGKVLKKQNNTGHLKRKWTSNKKTRKNRNLQMVSKGYLKKTRTLLGKHGSRLK